MTLVFMDGCETNDVLTKYDAVNGMNNSSYMAGRNGQALMVINGGGVYVKKILDAADEHATLIIGRAHKGSSTSQTDESAWVGGGGGYGTICSFLSDAGATTHISVCLELSRQITIRRGPMNGTVLGTYTVPALNYADWHYFEAKCVLSDTVGVVELKMDGQTILNLTGIDTKNGGTKTVFDSFAIGSPQTLNNVHGLLDDLYVCNGAGSVNNNFLGDVAIETLYPSGDGSSSQFLGSDGNSVSNYLLVDEPNAPVLTDYVEDSVSGHKDLYAIANLARTSGPVYGIQVTDHLLNTDAGAVSAKVSLKSGSTSAAGAAVPLNTAYKTARKVWEQNPDTSAPWDVTTVNAIEAGVEVV